MPRCKQAGVCDKDGSKLRGLATALVLPTRIYHNTVGKKNVSFSYPNSTLWMKMITGTKHDEAPTFTVM